MPKHPIRFGLQTGQQLVEWKELRDLWRNADSWGYDSLWTFDHFYPVFREDEVCDAHFQVAVDRRQAFLPRTDPLPRPFFMDEVRRFAAEVIPAVRAS